MKTLIIYYSLEGNTKFIADILAKTLKADTIRLEPVKDIKPTGLMKYMRGGKQVVMKETPEIRFSYESVIANEVWQSDEIDIKLKNYDLIIMGTPVRAFNYTPAFRTFFQNYKIEHTTVPPRKKIALFCTHEGGPGKTLTNMKDHLPNNEIIATKDFLNVAKRKEEATEEAEKWGKEIADKIK